jgi:Ca-activated chloride channel homolog
MPVHFSVSLKWVPFYGILFLLTLCLSACNDDSGQIASKAKPATTTKIPIPGTIQLMFIYALEKKSWITEVTSQFNANHYKTHDGQIIHVEAFAMNSNQIINELLSGIKKPHLISPASSAFIEFGNAKSFQKTGSEIVTYTKNLVLSPIVVALWKPMAEAIGFPKKNIGWAEMLSIAKEPQGWATYHYPNWGRFKLGHPHPEYSNSGLLSLFAQVYIGADKLTHLSKADLDKPQIADYVHKIQQMVAHYGPSSQFFQEKLIAPSDLSAAILYEHQVIQFYQQPNLSEKVVAIYPKEGTLFSNHPIGIVEGDWITPTHYEAAQIFMDYLLDKPQQEKALQYGFRPANVSVPLTSPIDIEHGVNPLAPKVILEMPTIDLMEDIIKIWHQHKKPANIVLVLDTSGGMRGEKIHHARSMVLQLLEIITEADYISLLSFNNRLNWIAKNIQVGPQLKWLKRQINYQFPGGGTALYDAVFNAYTFLQKNSPSDKIAIMIVLSDGGDSHSELNFKDLLSQIQFNSDLSPIRIFTVGYGSAFEKKRLRDIANMAQGKFYDGTMVDVDKIFKTEMANLF